MPTGLQEIADPLISSYRSAWERVLAEQETVTSDPRLWRRARRLEEMSKSIGSIMDRLDVEMSDWVSTQFPQTYGAGLLDGAAAAGTSPLWSTVHQEAVEQLAFGVYNDLLAATTHVKDTTKDLIRTLARQEGTTALITGETAQAAGRKLAKELAENGIAAVIYKDGSRHGLADYADMNLRTTTALGYNNGTLNAAPTTVFWEVFDGPGCGWTFHEDTEQALGKIVTRDEALSYPISHPRCRRSFGPRPDMNKTASAAEKLGSVKDSQVASQRAQDAERLAAQSRRSARTSRTPRGVRSPRVDPRVAAVNTRAEALVADFQAAGVKPDPAARAGRRLAELEDRYGEKFVGIHRLDANAYDADSIGGVPVASFKEHRLNINPAFLNKVDRTYGEFVFDPTPEGIVTHEYGHMLLTSGRGGAKVQDAQLKARIAARRVDPDLFISEYGETKISEWIPETFAAYHSTYRPQPEWVKVWGDTLTERLP